MNLLTTKTLFETVKSQSLDDLWHEAEQLGRIEVDHSFGGAHSYRVTIRFERKSGTLIYAKGNNTKIEFALADAINEAREMGA
jgi:hypothetical protein